MKSEAIVLPYYGIGDFLTHLPFVLAIAEKNRKSKFIILTKSRTFAKELLLFKKRIDVIYIENEYSLFSSIKEFFKLRNLFKKKKVSRIWIFHRSPRFAIIAFCSSVKERLGYGIGSQKIWLNCKNFLSKKFYKSFPIEKSFEFLKINNIFLDSVEPKLKAIEFINNKIKKKYIKHHKPWIVIGFGSTDIHRTWRMSNFINLIKILDKKKKCSFFLIGSPNERNKAERIISKCMDLGSNIINACFTIEKTISLISQSNFYVGNDTGSSNLALALGIKTFIIHGGTPPYTKTVYRNFYPKLYNSKFLISILPSGGVLRDPHLKGMDSIPRKDGMDLIKPIDVSKVIFQNWRKINNI